LGRLKTNSAVVGLAREFFLPNVVDCFIHFGAAVLDPDSGGKLASN
jgi:hypothetical protein